MSGTPRITRTLAVEAQVAAIKSPGEEIGGIFWWPDPSPWGDKPVFLELPNRHMDPEKHFQIDYMDIHDTFVALYSFERDHINGEVALFHSHPFGTGRPSREDEQAIEDFAKEMDGHPQLRPTFRHLIFALSDQSWWWYDLENSGRIGWGWPDE